MAQRKRKSRDKRKPRHSRPRAGSLSGAHKLRVAVDGLARTAETDAPPPWKWLPWILLLAFALRAAVALSGDFVLHPDEIMQYLEPAHRLAFGNGFIYWEYYYGARFYLIPMVVAAVLKLLAVFGLDAPLWYIGAVKLLLCAVSLLIPAGMYVFARRHFGETSARIALLAGAFWYELVGFAHKPMTEFIATALFIPLLALCVRPPSANTNTNTNTNTNALDSSAAIWMAAALAVLVAAIRLQYAPLAAVALALVFIRTSRKIYLTLAAGACFLAVGVFDAVSWGRGFDLFHSYLLNLRYNLHPSVNEFRLDESDVWQFMRWLLPASAGLSALVAALALREVRRYGFLLALIGAIILIHSLQIHKEYRFIFLFIPLWLMVFADIVARLPLWTQINKRAINGGIAGVFIAISIGGLLNALPAQQHVYRAYSSGTEIVGFLRNQDPVFAAYRYLAASDEVTGVWQPDRQSFNTPGYYYLHHQVPFYDRDLASVMIENGVQVADLVSHIVADADSDALPPLTDYAVDKVFGNIRIWRRQTPVSQLREWTHYARAIVTDNTIRLMQRIDPGKPGPNLSITFRPPEAQ